MKRNFKITEEQYNSAIIEGITLKADIDAANGDANKAIETTKKEAQMNGVNMDDAKIEIDANESVVITKKKLNEMKMNKMKSNSKFYRLNDFLNNLN